MLLYSTDASSPVAMAADVFWSDAGWHHDILKVSQVEEHSISELFERICDVAELATTAESERLTWWG